MKVFNVSSPTKPNQARHDNKHVSLAKDIDTESLNQAQSLDQPKVSKDTGTSHKQNAGAHISKS